MDAVVDRVDWETRSILFEAWDTIKPSAGSEGITLLSRLADGNPTHPYHKWTELFPEFGWFVESPDYDPSMLEWDEDRPQQFVGFLSPGTLRKMIGKCPVTVRDYWLRAAVRSRWTTNDVFNVFWECTQSFDKMVLGAARSEKTVRAFFETVPLHLLDKISPGRIKQIFGDAKVGPGLPIPAEYSHSNVRKILQGPSAGWPVAIQRIIGRRIGLDVSTLAQT
jgi:hypothetical protein